MERLSVHENRLGAVAYGSTILALFAEKPDMALAVPVYEGSHIPTDQSTRDMTGPDNDGNYDSTPDTEPDSRAD